MSTRVKLAKIRHVCDNNSEDYPEDIGRIEDFYDEMEYEEIVKHKMDKAASMIKNIPIFQTLYA